MSFLLRMTTLIYGQTDGTWTNLRTEHLFGHAAYKPKNGLHAYLSAHL